MQERRLMRAVVAGFALALVAVVAPAAPASANPNFGTYRACKYEDGPGPCVWDARHAGNGSGQSYKVLRNGGTVYMTHRRAHRLIHARG